MSRLMHIAVVASLILAASSHAAGEEWVGPRETVKPGDVSMSDAKFDKVELASVIAFFPVLVAFFLRTSKNNCWAPVLGGVTLTILYEFSQIIESDWASGDVLEIAATASFFRGAWILKRQSQTGQIEAVSTTKSGFKWIAVWLLLIAACTLVAIGVAELGDRPIDTFVAHSVRDMAHGLIFACAVLFVLAFPGSWSAKLFAAASVLFVLLEILIQVDGVPRGFIVYPVFPR